MEEVKRIFSYNSNVEKNAYLNWQMQPDETANNLAIMAENFSNAAMALMQSILSDNRDHGADSLIFPILYSIDHSIELYLKAILREIEILTKVKPSNYDTHDINSLYNNMMAQIKKKELKTKGLKNNFKTLENYIEELYVYISEVKGKPKMDFARYPVTTSGEAHFYIQAKNVAKDDEFKDTNVVVDVENLQVRYEEIRRSLIGIFDMYQAELEGKACRD